MTTVLREDTTTYQTTDLGLGAYLMANGIALLELGGSPGGRRVFVFPSQAAGLATAYYRNMPVPARSFFNSVKDLKALVRA